MTAYEPTRSIESARRLMTEGVGTNLLVTKCLHDVRALFLVHHDAAILPVDAMILRTKVRMNIATLIVRTPPQT